MPEVSYLFRYRDLIAKTLAEHQEIIAKERACWWGWWKRPLEHARMDVWNALAEQIDKDGHVWVGLFDSGSNKAYPAKLTKVILPRIMSGLVDDCEQLEPPRGEERLVPVYYRTSPFSRAWMKLDEIHDTELRLFGSNGYVYRKAPPLVNFDPAALTNHLVGKTISDGAELRAMDTTIWEVEPAKAGARAGVVFTFGSHLYPPVGGVPIQLKHNSILHITDLHYSVDLHRNQHAWKLDAETLKTAPTLADAISTALSVDNVKIGAIAVTGDLTFLGSTAEFDAASSGLNSLLGKLDLGHEHLVVVPGNHDIQWTKKTTYKREDKVTEAPEAATKNYKDFFAKLYRHEPDSALCMARRYVMPNGAVVEIAALNSSSLETGKNFLAGMGRIEEHSLSIAANALGWQPGQPSRALRILAVHHHLIPTDNVESVAGYGVGFGMAIDGPRILRLAASYGVQLVIHGHKHRAFLWHTSVFDLPEDAATNCHKGYLAILGGGSAGSSERPNDRNYFSVLRIHPDQLQYLLYQSSNSGAFQKIGDWCATISVTPTGHATLEPWSKK